MNKQDKILIIIVLFIVGIIFIFFKLFEKKDNLFAYVYYEDKVVLKIDLAKEETIYEVNGYNGIVKISAGNNKVKVLEEDSPLHICSKQGYITKSYESIVCLPNKIVVKIKSNDELDTIVK